jgi:hypothetical protein
MGLQAPLRRDRAIPTPYAWRRTIRRYNDSHEDTKGHELHAAPDTESEIIEFPGMVELWKRYWSEIPKLGLEVK